METSCKLQAVLLLTKSCPWSSAERRSPVSPNKNPCDVFMWGVIKDRFYNPMPATMNELKEGNKDVFNTIPEENVRKACDKHEGENKEASNEEGRGFEG